MREIFASIQRPTLLLDEERTRRNIQAMARKAAENRVRFRPHFKTHQSQVIGEWFRDEGVTAITVSSIDMAGYFAARGWYDITIAFPVNVRQMTAINDLVLYSSLSVASSPAIFGAPAIVGGLNLLVESTEAAALLGRQLKHRVSVWMKVDTGYGRTGIAWDDERALRQVGGALADSERLEFRGLLSHAGHTYRAGAPGRVVEIFYETASRLDHARSTLGALGRQLEVSVGDTPGCSLAPTLAGVDEIRPGNFVFYDLAQLSFGACTEQEISVALACPVVAKHRSRSQIVVHGGAVHLSLDRIPGPDGAPVFGRVALPDAGGWTPMFERSFVKSLSQEHGIVQAEAALFDQVEVGDLLLVIPVHSCLTADLMGSYLTLDGEQVPMAGRPGVI